MQITGFTHRRLVLGATTAMLLTSFAALADDRADAILAASKAASGGAAWDSVGPISVTGTVSTGGLNGPVHATIDSATGRYTDAFNLGPASGREGYDGTTVWSVDPSGQPRVEGGGEARLAAVNQAYRDAHAFWFPQRHAAATSVLGQKTDGGSTYDVIRITPAGGRAFDLWIDTRTHLISRMAEQTENDLQTEYYSDFRTVQGVKVPFTTRTSIGDPRYDQVQKIADISVLPAVDAATFAIPPAPAPDFSFPAGEDRVSMPFQLLNNHIYVQVNVNGHTAPFVFDTGATNVISKEWEPALGVADQGALPGGGVGDAKQDVGLTRVDQISVGGLVLKNQVFATIAQDKWERVEGTQSAGLIGYEVAKRVVTVIDYARQRITFIKKDAFTPPAGVDAVHVTFNDHTPQIEGALDGIAGKFDIDTGSRATVDILGGFATAHNLESTYQLSPTVISGWGVGGPARSRVAYAHKLTLGGITLRDPLIELSAQTKGAFASPYYAGNVGGGILRHFKVTLDYPHDRLFLQPNENFGERDVFDRSGMWLMQSENKQAVDVMDVMPNGAAAQAGLTTADRITAVDGQTIADLPLPELRARFKQKAGTAIALTVAGPQGTRNVTLKLRDVMMFNAL